MAASKPQPSQSQPSRNGSHGDQDISQALRGVARISASRTATKSTKNMFALDNAQELVYPLQIGGGETFPYRCSAGKMSVTMVKATELAI